MADTMPPPPLLTKPKKSKSKIPKSKSKSKPKHKPPSSSTTTAAVDELSSSDDMKTLIHDHAVFFDRLIELIPAKFYLPMDSDDKPWFQGLSKSGKAEAKLKSIENIKLSRRNRLDPETSKSTLDLLTESIEKSKKPDDGATFNLDDLKEDDDNEENTEVGDEKGEGKSVTYEELRERLRRKIEELRGGRGEGQNVKERREEKKRKRDEKKPREGKNNERGGEEIQEKERDVEKEADEAAEGIRFGKLKLGEEGAEGKRKRKKLSKEKELERAVRLEEEAKVDPELAKKQAWKVAMDKAKGIKVHDDPKKLKESIKKEKKEKMKSAEKWKDRVESTESKKKEKQEKRKENIKSKIDKKKMKKIEKREKKLMRPGFEGRKAGFITGGD